MQFLKFAKFLGLQVNLPSHISYQNQGKHFKVGQFGHGPNALYGFLPTSGAATSRAEQNYWQCWQ